MDKNTVAGFEEQDGMELHALMAHCERRRREQKHERKKGDGDE